MDFKRSDFPEGFIFGAATAAYQIEGHKYGGAGSTHWDTFAAGPGNVVRAEDGATACDHYHRWRGDLDIIQSMGVGAYRFSVAWPRVLPEGHGRVEERGLDFYDKLVDGLLERGIDLWVTLYHWDLPQALQDRGGWVSREVVDHFVDYARVVCERLGDRVTGWITHNEP